MGLFDKKKKDEEEEVSGSGAPTGDPANDAPQYVTVDAFKQFEERIAATLEKATASGGAHLPPPPPPKPPEDPDKNAKARIAKIDVEIDALTDKIDEAVQHGASVKDLYKQRDRLTEEKIDIKTQMRVASVTRQASPTLNALANEVYGAKMEHLSNPKVRKTFERNLSMIPAEYQSNPETLRLAYKNAVGEHFDELYEEKAKKMAAKQREEGTQDAGGANVNAPKAPPAEDPANLSEPAQVLLKRSGMDADTFAKRMGYKDWATYRRETAKYIAENETIQ